MHLALLIEAANDQKSNNQSLQFNYSLFRTIVIAGPATRSRFRCLISIFTLVVTRTLVNATPTTLLTHMNMIVRVRVGLHGIS